MKSKLKVVVYTICRDESQFVERWMDSMKEADKIVVLDTGSADNTVNALRERGALVEVKKYEPWTTLDEYKAIAKAGDVPWRFDWARNDSIDLANRLVPDADILVCTDLDEVLLPGWRTRLEDAWQKYAAAHEGEYPTTGQYEYVWNFNADGSDGTKFWYEKVHQPHAARWAHPVHEILEYKDGAKTMVRVDGMRLEHHADPAKSRGQYLQLLELSVEEAPNDDRNMHYLGREYMFRGMWDKAIDTLKRHLKLPTARWNAERAASYRFIAKCYGEKGDDVRQENNLWRAIWEAQDQREAALELAELAYAKHDMPLLVTACERCLAVKTRNMSYLTKAEAWGYRPWDLYAIGLWYTGHPDEAIAANVEALKLAPDNERLKKNDEVMRAASKAK